MRIDARFIATSRSEAEAPGSSAKARSCRTCSRSLSDTINTPSILKRGVRNQDRARLIKASQERVDRFRMLTNCRSNHRRAHLIKGCEIPFQAITIPFQSPTKVKDISIGQNRHIRSFERVREHHKDLSLKTEEKRDICSDTSKCSMYSTTQKQRQPYSRLTGEIGGLDRPAQGILRRGRITLRCRHARMPQQPLDRQQIPLSRIRGRRKPMPQRVEGPPIP